MSALAHTTALTEGERSFLQFRVARFGLVSGLILGTFWLYRALDLYIGLHIGTPWLPDGLGDPTMYNHLLASLSLIGVWVVVGRGTPSGRLIRTVEVIGLVAASTFLNLMALQLPLPARPDYIVIMALTAVLTVRAVYVPSTWRRSLLLAALMGGDVLFAVYHMWIVVDLEAWAHIQPSLSQFRPIDSALFAIANATAWWTVTMATTTSASHVIYGLRKDARQAKQLGQYKLEQKLGEGGMGMVFRAHHALLRRPTAVKLLLPDKAGERSIERFEREVRLMARLRHPNTVTVFDYGRSPDGVFYYAMELIDGATLADVVAQTGPMEPRRAIALLRQAAAAMVEAHGIGLIHRDIKPANMMVHLPHRHGAIGESVKMLDFGLVKELETSEGSLTNADTVTGTPQYMSPEAITRPDQIDARTDVYALGCVLFFLLTGEHVFTGATVMEICALHLKEPPDTVQERTAQPCDPAIERLIADCLKKDPEDRIQTALELDKRLGEIAVDPFTAQDAGEWWDEYGGVFHTTGAPVERQLLTMDLARAQQSPTQ